MAVQDVQAASPHAAQQQPCHHGGIHPASAEDRSEVCDQLGKRLIVERRGTLRKLVEGSYLHGEFDRQAEFFLHDEAQQCGRPAYANSLRYLVPEGIEINFGDQVSCFGYDAPDRSRL